jgi:hypothetical protein
MDFTNPTILLDVIGDVGGIEHYKGMNVDADTFRGDIYM